VASRDRSRGDRHELDDRGPRALQRGPHLHRGRLGRDAAERLGRVYRFLLPKVCGNLAYIGLGDPKQLAPAAVPATCSKSAAVAQCKPWCEVKVDPAAVVVHSPTQLSMAGGYDDSQAKLAVAGPKHATPLAVTQPPYEATYRPDVPSCTDKPYDVSCEAKNAAGDVATANATLAVSHHLWIFRPSLFWFSPLDGEQKRDIPFDGGTARERFEIQDGFGIGAALERRFGQVLGLEGALQFGRAKSEYTLTSGAASESADHNVNFYALTVGPNFHLLAAARPTSTSGRSSATAVWPDPNYWALGHHFHADFSGDFVWACSSASTCRSSRPGTGASTPACAGWTSPRTPTRAPSTSIPCSSRRASSSASDATLTAPDGSAPSAPSRRCPSCVCGAARGRRGKIAP